MIALCEKPCPATQEPQAGLASESREARDQRPVSSPIRFTSKFQIDHRSTEELDMVPPLRNMLGLCGFQRWMRSRWWMVCPSQHMFCSPEPVGSICSLVGAEALCR